MDWSGVDLNWFGTISILAGIILAIGWYIEYRDAKHDDECENRKGGEYHGKKLNGKKIPCHCPARKQGREDAARAKKVRIVLNDGSANMWVEMFEYHPYEPSNYCWDPGWLCEDPFGTCWFINEAGDVFEERGSEVVGYCPSIKATAEHYENQITPEDYGLAFDTETSPDVLYDEQGKLRKHD